MKTTLTSFAIVLGLMLGSATPALADRGGHSRGYDRPQQHRDYYRGPAYPRAHSHGRRSNWVAPAAVLAITGIAAGIAAAAYYSPPPAPVYVAPPAPVYVQPPSAYWNYCRSLGQYYPNVSACPEGWQLVPAR
ncbi:MAG: hypothetical protein V5B32_02670 [Candidatus Accumulibacter sp. UW26]|jgi:hypothetical protein